MQESPRKGRKIGSTVLESESDLSKAEEAPLLEEADLKKQSFWQKLSQIINLPGIWLFLQILFVSHATFPSIDTCSTLLPDIQTHAPTCACFITLLMLCAFAHAQFLHAGLCACECDQTMQNCANRITWAAEGIFLCPFAGQE